MSTLTKRQQEIVDFIRDYQRGFGFAPSLLDIQHEFGFGSPNSVMCHLVALRRKGVVDWMEGVAWTVRVLEAENGGIPIIDLEKVTSE